MESASGNSATIAAPARVSIPATLAVTVGIAAAWIAAGSSGLLAHSLRHVLTCLMLGACIVAGWPSLEKKWQDWILFGGGILVTFLFAVLPLETVNVLAVVIILSTLAHFHRGVDGRALFLSASAVFCFAVVHFLFRSYPPCWIIENQLGQSLGWMAAKMTGKQLSTGATFGGVDFLLLMGFLYGLWLYNSKSPRTNRAVFAGIAIIIAQFAYLTTLAFSEKILAHNPPVYPLEDDYLRVGATVWQNSLRAMIPWNLPIVAIVLQSLVAAMMFRFTAWRDDSLSTSQNLPSGLKPNFTQFVPPKSAKPSIYYKLAPAVVAMLLAGLTSLWMIKPDLNGKTILAYRSAEVSWTTPKQGQLTENGYGLLADYVQTLGGKFSFSQLLTKEELSKADLVILLNPDAKFSSQQQADLDEFVSRGGSLLLAGDRIKYQPKLNEQLKSTGIQITSNMTVNRTEGWEQSCQMMNHPVTLGSNDPYNSFGLESAYRLSVKGFAYPLLVGRWGWDNSSINEKAVGLASVATEANTGNKIQHPCYEAGDRLGDLVLMAETNRGNGKIVILGDMTCLSNDMLPVSYEFLGRLMGYLAQKTPAISLWRTAGVLLFAAILLILIIAMRKASQTAMTAFVFAAALVFCGISTIDSQRIKFGDAEKFPRPLALIDASHLEAYSDKLWHPLPTVKEFISSDWPDQGLGHFTRTLESNGYLPLRLKELTPASLEAGNLLILNAPGRRYSSDEMQVIQNFAARGGTLICIAGAEESRAINPLLEKFNIKVPPSPVSSHEKTWEPMPDGSKTIPYTKPEDNKQDQVQFYAAWDVVSLTAPGESEDVMPQIYFTENNRERWIIVKRNVGGNGGCIAVIADTYFAANANPDPSLNAGEENDRFWKWFLPRVAGPVDSVKKKTHKTSDNAPDENESNESNLPQNSEPDEG